MTSVDLRGDRGVIKREIRSGEYETITLTFAEVCSAAEVLREHLLALTPPEIPAEPELKGPRQIREDGSLAPDEDPALFGPCECAECSGRPWTICGVCGRQGKPSPGAPRR